MIKMNLEEAHPEFPKKPPCILAFREFVMNDPLPLSAIHNAVFEFLRGRMMLLCSVPRLLCEELRDYLNRRFRIAVRIRKVGAGSAKMDLLRT